MWLLSVTDQPDAALAQYVACCRILEQELGVPPAEETTALYEQVKQGRVTGINGQTHPHVAAAATPQVEPDATISTPADERFVGRKNELQTLQSILQEVWQERAGKCLSWAVPAAAKAL